MRELQEHNMRTLINNVIQWANDRNIIEGSTAIKQLDKTSEEFNELQRAVAVQQYVLSGDEGYLLSENITGDVVDAYGDILVTLIISAHQLGIDLEDALESAWLEIKDRKGKLINGIFHKEAE